MISKLRLKFEGIRNDIKVARNANARAAAAATLTSVGAFNESVFDNDCSYASWDAYRLINVDAVCSSISIFSMGLSPSSFWK